MATKPHQCMASKHGLIITMALLLWLKVSESQGMSSLILSSVDFHFQEEQNPGTYVGNVGVASRLTTSLSAAEFSRLKFELLKQQYFVINEKSGSLTSATKIDREDAVATGVCASQAVCKISVDVIVYTQLNTGSYDILKVINVNIEIIDINDNSPKFLDEVVSLSIAEGNNFNDELPTRGAVDKDSGINSIQQYSFKDPTETFALSVRNNPEGDSYLGIVVRERLDRETRDFYQLTILAFDGGIPQKSGSTVINITVTDINDNAPEFDQLSYNASVQENVPFRKMILKLHATDKDIGTNAEISYQFSSRVSNKIRQKFKIDEQTGEISAQSNIDYEEDKLIQFIVEAVDHGVPQQSSRANVNIHVTDVNDNWPQISFNLPPMGTEVSENEPIGKFVAQVLASDADSGSNGAVTCTIDDQHFSLETFNDNASNMYKIVLGKQLDYEEASSLRVTITCKDGGFPSLSNSTTFVVNVLDANDNRPVFSESTYYATVMENQDGINVATQVTATDLDSGDFGRITYSLEDKYDGLFSINPTSGTVSVLHTLDREYVPKYEFHVIAKDNGPERLSSSALVVVTVDDENDEPPRFKNPVYFGHILENQPIGTYVGNVTALDLDTPANSRMVYSILQIGLDYSNFSIDSATGIIKSTTTFNREVKDSYFMLVRVMDPTNSQFFSTCNFTVRILDDNDHSPVIHLSIDDNSTLIVQSSTGVGQIITTIFAYDEDDPTSTHSDFIFTIQDGDPYQLFNLNRFTGSLSMARMVSARDIRTYSLVIMVQDGGDPPKFDTKHLNIKINGTIPPAASLGLSQNILIAIVLVGVTVFLALVILLIILLIKKLDQRRREKKKNDNNADEKMYHLKQQEIFTNLSVNMGDGIGANNLNRRGRKEVSFSLDEESDAHNTSNGSSTQPLTSFKGGMNRPDLFSQNKLSGPSNNKMSNGLMNIAVYADKQGNRRSPRDEKNPITDILKKSSDDVTSQSSEETDPSDSGRGGSEDDSSHRGSGVDPEHSSKLCPQTYHRGPHTLVDARNRHQVYNQQRLSLHPPRSTRQMLAPTSKDIPYRQTIGSQRSPLSSITSDFESDYSGDPSSSIRSDMDRSLSGSSYTQPLVNPASSGRGNNQTLPFRSHENSSSRGVSQEWANRMTPSFSTSNNIHTNNNNNSVLMRSFHEQANNRDTVCPPLTSLSTERLVQQALERPYTSSSSSDRSYKFSDRSFPLSLRTNTQSSLTEDDRTTTSGSFLVNPEELRREIDSMIVRDSVV